MTTIELNGSAVTIDAEADTPLLYVLREDFQLNGAKFGCGLGQCGACTVLVEGEAVFSCTVPIGVLAGKKVTTLEGLGTIERPGRVQRAFIEEQAAQCGYCIPGFNLSARVSCWHAADRILIEELRSRYSGTAATVSGASAFSSSER